jgi:hypothetical protein
METRRVCQHQAFLKRRTLCRELHVAGAVKLSLAYCLPVLQFVTKIIQSLPSFLFHKLSIIFNKMQPWILPLGQAGNGRRTCMNQL